MTGLVRTRETHGARVCVRGVGHAFGSGETRKAILQEVVLDLFPGEIVIMTGPSGSGKTTLLTLIGALRAVQQGELTTLGRDLHRLRRPELVSARRDIGFIFQAHNLFESLSARENVNLALDLTCPDRAERDRRSAEALTRLGLGERLDYKPQALSGGQRQRVAVARALVNGPRLVLADEPTAALDRDAGRLVVDLLRSLAHEQGTTVLMVTHDSRILDVADRIVNVVDGRVVSDAAVQQTVDLCELLLRCPLFASRPASTLAELAQRMTRHTFGKDEVVIRQGEVGDRFYVLTRGTAAVQREDGGETRVLAQLAPGGYFGETALLTGDRRNATVVALEPLEAFALGKEDFQLAVGRSQTLEEQLRGALSQRR
jgi:putative ABC transport system ATP-binding protein